MSDPRERMARALCCPNGCWVIEGKMYPGQCEMDETHLRKADAALALAREMVAEGVPVMPGNGACALWSNSTRRLALQALGGEP